MVATGAAGAPAILGRVGVVGDVLARAARATPAAVEACDNGWELRHVDNGTWWSGAVLAHGATQAAGAELERRIDAAEWFYAGLGAVARFQVCADCPAGLDRALDERGYRRESPVRLLTGVAGALRPVHPPPGMTLAVDTVPTRDWRAVLGATGEPGTDQRHETRLLHRVAPQACLVVFADGTPVGAGRAVAESGWTGIFSMATTPPARRRGVARLVMSAIEAWAQAHDAPRLYLQVEQSNQAGRRFYRAAGFTELARYHYRVGAVTPSPRPPPPDGR